MTTESPETLNIRYVAFDHARKLMHPGGNTADVVKRAGEIERYLKGEKSPEATKPEAGKGPWSGYITPVSLSPPTVDDVKKALASENAPFAPLPPLDRIMIDTKYLPVGSTCIVNSFFGNQYEIKRVR